MRPPDPTLLASYSHLMRSIYPKHLRDRYHHQMLQTARDANADRTCSALQFWARLYTDLVRASIQEHTRMFRNEILARPVFFYTLALGLILTICGAAASLTFQQMLRRGANQPQVQMADQLVSELNAGRTPAAVIPSRIVDLHESLEPFAIFYDQAGVPVASSGRLETAIPVPPSGVFGFVRAHASDIITWQPQHGVRIAAVIRRVDGPTPGYVLTGRSLRVVEQQESAFWRIVFSGWVGLLVLLGAGAALLSYAQNSGARRMATEA